MYDLILKRGSLIDPSQSLTGVHDIAIEQGMIARIAPAIPDGEARRVIEAKGLVVTPGLIDLHAHVFEGFTRFGVNPDMAGVHAGAGVETGDGGRIRKVLCMSRHVLPFANY